MGLMAEQVKKHDCNTIRKRISEHSCHFAWLSGQVFIQHCVEINNPTWYVYGFLGDAAEQEGFLCPQHTPHLLPPSHTHHTSLTHHLPLCTHVHQPCVIFLQVGRIRNVKFDTITQSPWHSLFICWKRCTENISKHVS